jgi:hypothetical protein
MLSAPGFSCSVFFSTESVVFGHLSGQRIIKALGDEMACAALSWASKGNPLNVPACLCAAEFCN